MRAPRAEEPVTATRLPPLLLLTLLAITLLPAELSVMAGGLRVTPLRALLLLAAPAVLLAWLHALGTGRMRLHGADAAMLGLAAWIMLANTVSEGLARALATGGSSNLEFLVVYLLARLLAPRPAQVRRAMGLVALAIAGTSVFAVLDTLSGTWLLKNALQAVTGIGSPWTPDHRFGLVRAAGVYEVHIMLGLGSLAGGLLALSLRGGARLLALAGCGTGLLLSLSAGPLLGALLCGALLLYGALTPGFEARWRLVGAGIALALAALFALHPNPFEPLFRLLTFDPASAHFRRMIWEEAGAVVLAHPLWGIGMADWARPEWMPSSVDALWLRMAMMWGLPAAGLMALAFFLAGTARVPAHLPPEERFAARLLGLGILAYAVVGITVFVWGINWALMALLPALRVNLAEAR
jgi:hypothetical protein